MKHLTILFIVTLLCSAVNAQTTPAFDGTLTLNMSLRNHQNSSVGIQAGINGRRLPFSILAGASYMEFQNYKTEESKLGLNATAMLRLASIQFRSTDLNAYATAYKFDRCFFEYGAKIGMLINDRSRIYLSLGTMQGSNYHSFVAGVHFNMFFFNGYSAY